VPENGLGEKGKNGGVLGFSFAFLLFAFSFLRSPG
jgi:hypothetical protein